MLVSFGPHANLYGCALCSLLKEERAYVLRMKAQETKTSMEWGHVGTYPGTCRTPNSLCPNIGMPSVRGIDRLGGK
jgi:hypothetical protein